MATTVTTDAEGGGGGGGGGGIGNCYINFKTQTGREGGRMVALVMV